jgi:GTPase
MTSSVTQELIGYRDIIGPDGTKDSVQVVSYGNGDVSEWLDIHASAEGGRLVFLSDSAGHPRFRRTTVRGLVGWDPNWTLLCISADSTEDSVLKVQELPGTTPADTDLSQAHLRLCLNLELPLVVVITKYDLATKQGLRHTLSRLLSAIKDAGRTPRIVSAPSEATSEIDLNTVSACDLAQVRPLVQTLESSSLAVVPIILTSAVKGVGITILHALLRELPLPSIQEPKDDTLETLFHIEDVYSNILAPARDASLSNRSDRSVVIAGHLRYGTLRIGQELLLGPYVVDTVSDDSDSGSGPGSTLQRRRPHSSVPTSRSFPGALSKRSQLSAIDKQLEWRSVRITSLRNLRLPVRSLHAGQVGTIGIAPVDVPIAGPAAVRIRKGMVLGKGQLRAHRIIAVKFTGSNADAVKGLSVGSGVVVYVASVRASAKVVSVAAELDRQQPVNSHHDEEDAAFGFGFDDDEDDTVLETTRAPATVVTFQFIASREFFEVDAKVLVLPGGGPGLYVGTERGEKGIAALEGFVGRVTEGC